MKRISAVGIVWAALLAGLIAPPKAHGQQAPAFAPGEALPTTVKLKPVTEIPLVVYEVPIGSSGTIAFELPTERANVERAELALMADDFDDRKELTIRFNGSDPLPIPDEMIGDKELHPGRIEIPLDLLRDGRNEAVFTFVDDLGGTTGGFEVDEAYLVLTLKQGSRMKDETTAANLIEHRGGQLFEYSGARKVEAGIDMPFPVSSVNAILETLDGKLAIYGGGYVVYSEDGGRTWSEKAERPVVHWPFRMNDGKLGGCSYGKIWEFLVSDDGCKTWETRGRINVGDVNGVPYGRPFIQTKSGRILMPVRFTGGAAHEGIYAELRAWGTIKGEREPIEGHAHYPEPDITFVYFSDDGGHTWKRSEGGIMIWHKDGLGGMWPCDEPCIVERKDGDLLLFLRTSLGRVYTSHSGHAEWAELWGEDKGKKHTATPGYRWDLPVPTELAVSYSPCKVRRIPKTGDLLIVWNQVSGDEIRAGYRRGRLSSAISKDDGKTWQHFRTLDRVVLPPAGRVEPDPEPQMARAFKWVGVLPDDYGAVDYPEIGFWKDQVVLAWYRSVRNPKPGETQGLRLRVTPLAWFYSKEPPYEPPKPTPALFIKSGASVDKVESLYCDERFFVRMSDVVKVTGDKIDADMFAPIHQVLTYLGYAPVYDDSRLTGPDTPCLTVGIQKK